MRGQLGSDTEWRAEEKGWRGGRGTGRCPVAAAAVAVAAGRLSVVQSYLPPKILCNYESFWRSALNINAARCQRYGKNVIINSSSSSRSSSAKPQLNPNYAGWVGERGKDRGPLTGCQGMPTYCRRSSNSHSRCSQLAAVRIVRLQQK